jgi:putative transposase
MKQSKHDDGFRLSDELWERMKPLLPAPKAHPLGCHRLRVPNRAAMDAILLVLRTGMQWMAPDFVRARRHTGGFGSGSRRMYLKRYGAWGCWNMTSSRASIGLKHRWAGKNIGPNPCDRAKGGVKHSTLTEAAGIPLAVEVAPANRHDMELVAVTLAGMMCARPVDDRTIRLCLDLGYDYDDVRFVVRLAGFEPVVLGRSDERENKKQRGARAHRWVVERTHSWLNRFRRLLVRWEKREDTYLAMLHFACGLIAWRSALSK